MSQPVETANKQIKRTTLNAKPLPLSQEQTVIEKRPTVSVPSAIESAVIAAALRSGVVVPPPPPAVASIAAAPSTPSAPSATSSASLPSAATSSNLVQPVASSTPTSSSTLARRVVPSSTVAARPVVTRINKRDENDSPAAAASAAAAVAANLDRNENGDDGYDGGGLSAELLLFGLLFVLISGTVIAFGFQAYMRSTSGGGGRSHPFASSSSSEHGRKMADTSFRLVVPLETLMSGGIVTVDFPRGNGAGGGGGDGGGGRQVRCSHCEGHGALGGSEGVSPCASCEGHGRLHHRRQVAPGFFQDLTQICSRCGGKGKVIPRACPHCAGQGVVHATGAEAKLSIQLPQAAPDGWVVTLPEAGDQPTRDQELQQGVKPGDVRITIQSQPHPVFTRRRTISSEQHHLETKLSITLREALLGFSRKLILPNGSEVSVSSSSEDGQVTQPGQVLLVSGAGMPPFDGAAAALANEAYRPTTTGKHATIIERANDAIMQAWKMIGMESATVTAARKQSTPRGDLYVTISVQWPKKPLTTEQAAELRTLIGN